VDWPNILVAIIGALALPLFAELGPFFLSSRIEQYLRDGHLGEDDLKFANAAGRWSHTGISTMLAPLLILYSAWPVIALQGPFADPAKVIFLGIVPVLFLLGLIPVLKLGPGGLVRDDFKPNRWWRGFLYYRLALYGVNAALIVIVLLD